MTHREVYVISSRRRANTSNMSDKFYELQEWARGSGTWSHIAYFRTRQQAKKHSKEFNVLVEVNKMRIVEREFKNE